jgi:MFS transporter, YNFM family, putative membrane transport protein
MARMLIIFLSSANIFILLYAPQPILPLFASEFHISTSQASLAISITIITMAFTSLFFSTYFDRWERKKTMLICSFFLIFPSIMLCFSKTFAEILIWRFFHGILIPGVNVVIITYISEEFPKEKRGQILGIYVSATVVGGLIGRVISGPIAEHFSWQAVFAGIALFSAMVFFLKWKHLPSSTKQPISQKDHRGELNKSPSLVAAFLIGFLQFFAMLGFFNYLPFYAAEEPLHLSPSQISYLYFTYIFGIFSAPLAGFLSDRVGRRLTMALGNFIVGIAILITLWTSLLSLLIGASLVALGNFASQSATTAFVNDAGKQLKGAATSIYQFFYYLGGSLGTILPGFLWNKYAWNGVVYLTTSFILLAILLNLFLAGKSSWSRN